MRLAQRGKWIGLVLTCFVLARIILAVPGYGASPQETQESAVQNYAPDQLIRFHVIANSDTDADQALKRAVRDAILKEVAPKLAASRSLDESRRIVKGLRPEIEEIGRKVVAAWGRNYDVTTQYGIFPFPTKSYGSLVLPAGNYEALRVVIGAGKGANWWCVLFPPLCFVDIDHATAVPVDTVTTQADKQGNGQTAKQADKPTDQQTADKQTAKPAQGQKQVKFWFWEKIKSWFNLS